ncbi:heat shock protein 70 family [Pelagophyceae sp. CCMP2097]|nr:heat shock protein 70 family [Pelagophyceae sp. CCMP2097]|mmetsp:Transcript_21173/g.71693  ORF Transcript_21173/g.71693 Transcript_21173/m.71693 type:complete len:331 (-) Transcript_21173:2375-3367(-)
MDADDFLSDHYGLADFATRRCVVGVPARFDAAARQATTTACKLGGFDDVRLIAEPEAAALCYGAVRASDDGAESCVLVFDLGGGTFDASVVLLKARSANLIALGGDAKLGGDDFDAAIAEHLGDAFFSRHGVAVQAQSARLRLLLEAERCKKTLSTQKEISAKCKCLAKTDASGARSRTGACVDLEEPLTRRALETLWRPLLKRLESETRRVCETAGVDLPDDAGAGARRKAPRRTLARILLVGGSSRMPVIGRMLRRVTGLPLSKIAANDAVHPDEAVALGAAIFASMLDADHGMRDDAAPAFKLDRAPGLDAPRKRKKGPAADAPIQF